MEYLNSFWQYLEVSSPFLLLGLGLAGLIHEFLPMEWVKKWLGKDGVGSIVKASIIGVPLPLCSCSVIPTAVTLRKSGASNGATSSFLISTPETGVDSISMTYAMMDIPMTILRPIVAFLSSFLAGIFQVFFNDFEMEDEIPQTKSCCQKSAAAKDEPQKKIRFLSGLTYGFKDIINDISLWLFVGLLLGALINQLFPPQALGQMNGIGGRLGLLVIGVPLYICASATTPIAASLMLKGMSPGTALILLMVGPATNIGNLAVLQKYIGKKGVLLNILALVISSLLFSFLIDDLYGRFDWPLNFKIATHQHEESSFFSQACSAVLLLLIFKGIWQEEIKPRFFK